MFLSNRIVYRENTNLEINQFLSCEAFPCIDVNKKGNLIPKLKLNPEKIRIIMIIEGMPEKKDDYFHSQGNPASMVTTKQAFNDTGEEVKTIDSILDRGIYLTPAIKFNDSENKLNDLIFHCFLFRRFPRMIILFALSNYTSCI